MSRNIGSTCCYFCGGPVILCGGVHPITMAEAGCYVREYAGMIVAEAECSVCLARYLAWVSDIPSRSMAPPGPPPDFLDLSFRSTFNDEPGERDFPVYRAARVWVRLGLYAGDCNSSYYQLGPVNVPEEP